MACPGISKRGALKFSSSKNQCKYVFYGTKNVDIMPLQILVGGGGGQNPPWTRV